MKNLQLQVYTVDLPVTSVYHKHYTHVLVLDESVPLLTSYWQTLLDDLVHKPKNNILADIKSLVKFLQIEST
jgi:hypothetical protein